MKELMSLGVAIVIFIAFNQQQTRYTQQSPEIETYKQVLKDYENRDWEAMIEYYSDNAKIMNNVTEEEGKNLTQFLAENKKDASQFSRWDFVDDTSEYEMIVNDKGETWVNFWGLWEGTFKTNNKVYQIPTHRTAQFVNGKIVREFGYWDISKIIKDIQQTDELSSSEERTGN